MQSKGLKLAENALTWKEFQTLLRREIRKTESRTVSRKLQNEIQTGKKKLTNLHLNSVFIGTLCISFVPDDLLSCRFSIVLIGPLVSGRVLLFSLNAVQSASVYQRLWDACMKPGRTWLSCSQFSGTTNVYLHVCSYISLYLTMCWEGDNCHYTVEWAPGISYLTERCVLKNFKTASKFWSWTLTRENRQVC